MNTTSLFYRTIAVNIPILLFAAVAALAGDADGLVWHREDGAVALHKKDWEIWRFRYGKEDGKAAFHPLSLPGGPVMTCYRNEDHPWHRGMWFSWEFINGLDYWKEDKTGVAEGLTETSHVRIETRGDFTARISLDVSYRPPKGEPVLMEKRTLAVSAPDASGVYHIDWTMAFKAMGQDVLLDRDPMPGEPNGKGYGGFSGLTVRFAREMTDIQISSSSGPLDFPEKDRRIRRKKETAADYSGSVENQVVGIAYLDNPKNLNAPTPWYIEDNRRMKFFNPSVLEYGPHTLKAGESMTLRYRAILHFGRWDAGRLRAEVDRYVKEQE
jgi:Methane oxygenase PmoA